MNILLQLRCCDPKQGGEFGISWGWLTSLYKRLSPEDHIYVASIGLKQDTINEAGLSNVHVLNVSDTNSFIKTILRKIPFAGYILWQRRSYKYARSLGVKFDLIQLYSLSDFRHPGLWHKCKDAYTIFGPVGGGQDCPKALMIYDDKKELYLRKIVNISCKLNPFWQSAIRSYNKIYAVNEETAKYIPRADMLLDIALNRQFANLSISKKNNEKKVILFCGRLIKRKGVYLLIDIAEKMSQKGPEENGIKEVIRQKGLSKKVFLKGKLPYTEMNEAYKMADIFIFPSLRESGGNVLIEAMANALPIVSLNMSVSKQLNKLNTGIFIDPSRPKDDIIEDFVKALEKLIASQELRQELGMNGYQFVNSELNWDVIIDKVYGKII